MTDLILLLLLVLILGAAVSYIIREKKRGVTCIGCPHSGVCARKGKEGQECSGHEKTVK